MNIAIIGGWPAGLMSAASIIENTKNAHINIDIFEANAQLGRKLVISGGGRCNITTGFFGKKTLQNKYVRGFDFFKHSLGEFSPKKCYDWFEKKWLCLKIQDDNRVFPKSDNGNDVLDVFKNILHSAGVNIFYRAKVLNIAKNNSRFSIITKDFEKIYDIVILATGWNAYAHTGSTGDGYFFAKNLGHSISQLWPSLSSFLIKEDFIKSLSGISFPDAKIYFQKYSLSGSLLCTHFGISWPLAFMLSSHLAWFDINNFPVKIAPISGMWIVQWDEYLKIFFENNPKKILSSALKEKLPMRFVNNFLELYFPEITQTFLSQISAKNRKKIAELLWWWIPVTLLERRPWDEFVTAWGVNTDEIFWKTMQSKIQENLYFAWEILNIDGYTGGFSLQVCWSTGYAAGKHIATKIDALKK